VKALSDDLVIDDDGSFEIFFSQEKMGTTNWFQLPLVLTPFALSKFTATGTGNTRGQFASNASTLMSRPNRYRFKTRLRRSTPI